MKLSRMLLPTAIAGALILSGCSVGGAPSKDAAGKDCLAAGSVSGSIKVKGDVGTSLEITSETPVKAKKLERTVLKAGSGDVVKDGKAIELAVSLFKGTDGSVLLQQASAPQPFSKGALFPWAEQGLRCAVPGQEVVISGSFGEMYGKDPSELGLTDMKKSDALVAVMKFGKISDPKPAAPEPGTLEPDQLLQRAEGEAKPAPEGFPTVTLGDDGSPTITMPEGVNPPEKLEIATLIEGTGETVKPGDRVYVNYRGVIWRTGEEFDSSWSRGTPVPFITSQVIPGFTKALEGQKVGSQVISIVPAEDGGYGADKLKQMGHEPTDVMVFVLDILGTVSAK